MDKKFFIYPDDIDGRKITLMSITVAPMKLNLSLLREKTPRLAVLDPPLLE